MTHRLAEYVHRRARGVLVAALLVTLAALAAGGALLGDLTPGGFDDPRAEATQARERIEAAAGIDPGSAVAVLVTPGGDVRTGAGARLVDDVADRVAADPAVGALIRPGGPGGERQVSRDGRRAYVVALLRPGDAAARGRAADRLQRAFAGDARVAVGGPAVISAAITERVRGDLARAELIALPAVFLLALWVFRGPVAALLMPLAGGVVIVVTFAALGLVGQVVDVSVFSTNLVVALGLGLVVDYSLLVISRFRQEVVARGPGAEALAATLATAGRSVAVSAATVAAALAGLTLFPVAFLRSMGIGGMLAAAVAGVVAVVVLPAVLALLGSRVEAGCPARWRPDARRHGSAGGGWYRLSHLVARRARRVAAGAAVLLAVVAAPLLGIGVTAVDADALPAGSPARHVTDVVAAEFPRDLADAALVVTVADASPASRAAVAAAAERYRGLPGAREVPRPVFLGGDTWLTRVVPDGPALSDGAEDLVGALRGDDGSSPVLVGGPTARFVDQRAAIVDALPAAVLLVVAITLVALFLMTGSLAIPAAVVLLNALSISATLGILVWVFQWGHGEDLLGFTSQGAVGLTQPVLLGAVAFGLSTDYTVFLLSRVREERGSGLPGPEAVAVALQRTGRLITCAALLFAVAVATVATSDVVLLKEIGVGAAVAVLIDATVVRALLVPALLGVMGERGWWAPKRLLRARSRLVVAVSAGDTLPRP